MGLDGEWQIELAKVLLETGQSHLFEHWAEPGVDDEEKKAFFDQVWWFSFCISLCRRSCVFAGWDLRLDFVVKNWMPWISVIVCFDGLDLDLS